jgi:hypothetical protein
MDVLKNASTILDFDADGQPPDRYTVTFRGKGVRRDPSTGRIEVVDTHQCEIRLPCSFPQRPPDIRWLTPLFHPNISFGGFIRLRDIGIVWEESLTLDVVCDRLWDVARMAYHDEENASNHSAKRWLEQQTDVDLPVDQRPLRDTMKLRNANVVRYDRRGQSGLQLPDAALRDDVLYIGDDAPLPASEDGASAGGKDIFYIGDD